MGLDTFKKTAGNILRELRASKKEKGHDSILNALVVNKDKTDEISFRWDHNSSLSKKVDELKGNKFLD